MPQTQKRPRRFTVAPAIDGWEVVDTDGRMVDRRDTKRAANGVAFHLNNASERGQTTLHKALKCG